MSSYNQRNSQNSGCGIVSLIGLIASLIGIFVFITGRQSIPDILKNWPVSQTSSNTTAPPSISPTSPNVSASMTILPESASTSSTKSTSYPVPTAEINSANADKVDLLASWETQEEGDEEGRSVSDVAISPDSQLVAVKTRSGRIELYQLRDGTFLQTLQWDDFSAQVPLVFSPNSELLAFPSSNNHIQLWSLKEGKIFGTLVGHKADVTNLVFMSDQVLISASDDDDIRIWEVSNGSTIDIIKQKYNLSILGLAVSPNKELLAVGQGASNGPPILTVWNLKNGSELYEISEPFQWWVETVAFTSDNEMLLAGTADQRIYLWNAYNGKSIQTINARGDIIYSINTLTISPNNKVIASVSRTESIIKLWRITDGENLYTLEGHKGHVVNVVFSPDGKRIVSGGDTTIRIWGIRP